MSRNNNPREPSNPSINGSDGPDSSANPQPSAFQIVNISASPPILSFQATAAAMNPQQQPQAQNPPVLALPPGASPPTQPAAASAPSAYSSSSPSPASPASAWTIPALEQQPIIGQYVPQVPPELPGQPIFCVLPLSFRDALQGTNATLTDLARTLVISAEDPRQPPSAIEADTRAVSIGISQPDRANATIFPPRADTTLSFLRLVQQYRYSALADTAPSPLRALLKALELIHAVDPQTIALDSSEANIILDADPQRRVHWRGCLEVGMFVDCMDSTNTWYIAEIEQLGAHAAWIRYDNRGCNS